MGCANQAGEDNRNVARMALLLAGYPHTVPGETVNRLCASGMAAAVNGARMLACGDAEVVLAGGVEHMTRGPWVMSKASRRSVATANCTTPVLGGALSILGWMKFTAQMEWERPLKTSLINTESAGRTKMPCCVVPAESCPVRSRTGRRCISVSIPRRKQTRWYSVKTNSSNHKPVRKA